MNKSNNHKSAFKAQVALDAIRGEKTISELSRHYKVHPTQINTWKRQLLAGATELFEKNGPKARKTDECDAARVKELHAKIGELTVSNDFLSQKLAPWGVK